MRAFKKRSSEEDASQIQAVSELLSKATSAITQHASAAPDGLNLQGLAPAQEHGKYYGVPVGTIIEAPVKHIMENPVNARRLKSAAGLDEMAIKIAARGQDTAALAYIDGVGNICLIDGHRRLEAIKIAGKETLRVEVRPKPDDEKKLYLASRAANKDREDQSPLDDALAWKMLLEKKIFASQVELCRELEIDPTQMSRTLGLAELPKAVINMLAERPELMNLRMLDAIKRFADAAGEEATEALILEIERESLSSRDVDNRRMAVMRGPVSRKRSNAQIRKYARGEATIKRFEGQGRMVLEIKQVKDENFVTELERRITEAVEQILGEAV